MRNARHAIIDHGRRLAGLILAVALVASCGDDGGTGPGNDSDTDMIGVDGGTVVGVGGAVVEIPPGALDHEVDISIAAYGDPGDLPAAALPALLPLAGVSCAPDGTVFATPVTITLPTGEPLAPGTIVPLHVWDADAGFWAATPFVAIAAADGATLTAEVTHFSFFAGLPGSDALLGDIDPMLCESAAPDAILAAFQAQFREQVAAVDDHGVWQQECRKVVGINWDLHAESGGVPADIVTLEGATGDGVLSVSYQMSCSDGSQPGNAFDAMIDVYYDCAAPALLVQADPGMIEVGGSATVTANLRCGEQPWPGRAIQFECFGPAGIDDDEATTDPVGRARTMYANDGGAGDVTVRAYVDACEGMDQAATVTADAGITVGGDSQGFLHVGFSQDAGDGPLGVFQDGADVSFHFTAADGVVSGEGMLVHAVQIFPGDLDCWLDSVNAPAFPIMIMGTVADGQVELRFVPQGSMPLSFVMMCDRDDPSDYPYAGHGLLEGMVLYEDVRPSMSFSDGATDSGSGSQDFGGDIPLEYEWNVTIHRARY